MARGSISRRHGGYAIRVDLGPDPATGKRRQHYKQGYDWLVGQRQRLEETTWSSYEVAATRIKGGLGASKLKALTPLDIERFYPELAETGSRAVRLTATLMSEGLRHGDEGELGSAESEARF